MCFDEHISEFPLLLHHLGENEITGAIDDARKPIDSVGGKTLAQRFNNRNTPGYGALIGQDKPFRFCQLDQGHAALGNERLVGRDDMLTVL